MDPQGSRHVSVSHQSQSPPISAKRRFIDQMLVLLSINQFFFYNSAVSKTHQILELMKLPLNTSSFFIEHITLRFCTDLYTNMYNQFVYLYIPFCVSLTETRVAPPCLTPRSVLLLEIYGGHCQPVAAS